MRSCRGGSLMRGVMRMMGGVVMRMRGVMGMADAEANSMALWIVCMCVMMSEGGH